MTSTSDRRVAFVYMLLDLRLPAQHVEELIRAVTEPLPPILMNDHLAALARDYVERLDDVSRPAVRPSPPRSMTRAAASTPAQKFRDRLLDAAYRTFGCPTYDVDQRADEAFLAEADAVIAEIEALKTKRATR